MSAQQTLVGALGVGLIGANLWFGSQRQQIGPLLTGAASSDQADTAHGAAKQIGLEVLGVGAAVLLAGLSPHAGTALVMVLAALWLVFLLNRTPSVGHGAPPPRQPLVHSGQ